MSLLQTIYYSSPIINQHLMASVRGFQLRRLRYTPHTWRTFDSLMESQFWPSVKFVQYQLGQLKDLVRFASCNSQYYRTRYTSLKINPDDIRGMDDIRLLPVIAKEEYRKNADKFYCGVFDRKRMWESHTSGTTGTPLVAYHTHSCMQERIAFMERLYHWYIPKRWRKRASFTGKLMVDPDRSKGPFHRINYAMHQQLYSSHHLKLGHLNEYVNELINYGPEQIDGIASPIYVVADYLIRSGRAGSLRPRIVIPTSETLWPFIRARIESGFRCRVANQYGSQEGAPLAYECPEGGFHICPESGIFEILRPDDTPCAPGEYGRLIVTSFQSYGTPLIRYEIGDIAAWRGGVCACGRQMPLLLGIEGRIDDMFYTNERGIVPRIDSAFKSLPNSIIATQVAQVAIDRFEVRIIPDANLYKPEHSCLLVESLYDYLGRTVRIEVKIVPEIPFTKGGKLSAMVNECNDPVVNNEITVGWSKAISYGWKSERNN